MTTEPLEALLACTGLLNPKVTDAKVEASFELVDRLTRRLARWVLKPELKPWALPFGTDDTEHPQSTTAEKLYTKLGRPVRALEVEELSPEESQTFAAMASAARAAVVKLYPVAAPSDYLADLVFPLSPDEAQDFLAVVAVVDDPNRFLDEVEMGTLMPEQVSLFRLVYPSLYASLVNAVDDAIIDINTRKQDLDEGVETVLQVLLDTGQFPGVVPPAPEEKAPALAKVKLGSDDQKTLTERLAAR